MKRLKYYFSQMLNDTATYKEMYDGEMDTFFRQPLGMGIVWIPKSITAPSIGMMTYPLKSHPHTN